MRLKNKRKRYHTHTKKCDFHNYRNQKRRRFLNYFFWKFRSELTLSTFCTATTPPTTTHMCVTSYYQLERPCVFRERARAFYHKHFYYIFCFRLASEFGRRRQCTQITAFSKMASKSSNYIKQKRKHHQHAHTTQKILFSPAIPIHVVVVVKHTKSSHQPGTTEHSYTQLNN